MATKGWEFASAEERLGVGWDVEFGPERPGVGYVYAPYIPLMVFQGHAWTNKPKTKRLRKKVQADPWRYPRYAQSIYTEGMDPWPSKRERIERRYGR